MWRRERNRPRALLNGQFYEEERKLADMLAADLSEKRDAMSSIDMNSQLSTNHIEPTLIREKNVILCGRDWIEENLNYERRHRITDQIVDSAADFRKQNKTQCQASGYSETQTILMFPPEETPLAEIAAQTAQIELNETVDPADMRDERIVDYTLNKRLFPVPLFPNHQSAQNGQYARISVPSNLMKPTYKKSIPKRSDEEEQAESMSLWDHCQIGANPAGRPSHRRNQSTTRNKVDLRAHLAPHKEIDVYKVQAGHSFAKRPRDPFDLSKAY